MKIYLIMSRTGRQAGTQSTWAKWKVSYHKFAKLYVCVCVSVSLKSFRTSGMQSSPEWGTLELVRKGNQKSFA